MYFRARADEEWMVMNKYKWTQRYNPMEMNRAVKQAILVQILLCPHIFRVKGITLGVKKEPLQESLMTSPWEKGRG